MGQIISKNLPDKDVEVAKPVAKEVPLDSLLSFAYGQKEGLEPVVIFSRNLYEDPCSLLGRSIIDVTNELAARDRAVAFAVGRGPCVQCKEVTLFWWTNRDWESLAIPEQSNMQTAFEGYVKPRNLNSVYHLYADKNLIITDVVASTRRNGDILTADKACPAPVVAKESNLAETLGTNWWIWLIVILLILLIIFLIYRASRR